MPFLYLVEFLVVGVGGVFAVTQVIVPLWKGESVLPMFSEERRLERQLKQLERKRKRLELKRQIESAKDAIDDDRRRELDLEIQLLTAEIADLGGSRGHNNTISNNELDN